MSVSSLTGPRGAIEDAAPRLAPRVLNVVTALAVLAIIIGAIYLVLDSGTLRWGVIGTYLFSPAVLSGVGTTLLITAVSLLVSLVLGTLLAVMRVSRNVVLQAVSSAYIWFFRGTPVIVQVIFWFNLALFLPRIEIGSWSVQTNDLITPMNAALLAMSLNVSAFMAEIVRGGLISVDRGQTEAALSLGMTPARAMLKIVLPQAVRVILPPAGNLTIDLLKATSLVYVIGTKEILGTVQSIAAQNFYVIELLIVACIWYLALVSIASFFQSRLEKRFGRGYAATASVRRRRSRAPRLEPERTPDGAL